nr:hypothetical protein [Aureimonas ureilytica]
MAPAFEGSDGSKPLGMNQSEDEIESQRQRDRAAQNEVEHRQACPAQRA